MGSDPSDRAVQAVLELLSDHDLELQASNIAKNVGYSKGYTRRILRQCYKYDLVEKDDVGQRPFYTITLLGRRYLQKDLNADDIEFQD